MLNSRRMIKFWVNDEPYETHVESNKTLLELLRDDLGLLGVKHSCGLGECGACTVLIEGRATPSCLTLATAVDGKNILTIEGLAHENCLHPIQKAFVVHSAVQCGYCAPGLILTTKALLDENPNPTEKQIGEYIKGNLCRCTGYVHVKEAILDAARRLKDPSMSASKLSEKMSPTESENNLAHVGSKIPAVDSVEKVTGSAKYTSDLKLPRMLYARLKRSPYAHARIKSIDTSKARMMDGVRAIITGEDLPDIRYGYDVLDEYFLARGKVRYVGEPVAAVAAETIDIAEEALKAIKVDYEELPAVFDPEEAIKPNPPAIVHEDLLECERLIPVPKLDVSRPNVIDWTKIQKGDVRRGFESADLIIENRFTTPMQQHCAMEPHNALAEVGSDNSIKIWRDTQKPFVLRDCISRTFRIIPSKVRVIVPQVGGGFGGKTEPKMEPICVALAQKTKRPVRITLTREEVFSCTSNRHPCTVYIKDGVKKNGHIVAREMKLIWNAGAYCEISNYVAKAGAISATATYNIPNFKLDNYCVYTNLPITGAFRGFGSPQVQFAVEQQMDMIADKLNIDPVKIRMINCLDEGDENALGEKMHSVGNKRCLRKVAAELKWDRKAEHGLGPWRRGKGIALGNKYTIAAPSCAIVKVHPPIGDGDITIEVRVSTINLGQGAYTVFTQIAADEFRVPIDRVRVTGCDTDLSPYDGCGTVSSRSTFTMGNAIRNACQDAKKQILKLAVSKGLAASIEDLEIEHGSILAKSADSQSIPMKDIFASWGLERFAEDTGEIMGRGFFNPPTSSKYYPSAYYTHFANGAEVEVDTETGEVRVLKLVTAIELGKAINPILCEGQVCGGLSMGLSTALFEIIQFDRGKVMNSNFTDYKVIRAADLPTNNKIRPIMLEKAPHKEGPYGAKGIGEAVTVGIAPAISNAIFDAVGVRIKEVPITPEKIVDALSHG